MRRTCGVLVILAACTGAPAVPSEPIEPFLDLSKADGLPALLQYEDRSRIDVDEPSDLVQVGGHLYTVSDSHSKIYEIEPDGDTDTYLDIDVDDLESIGFDPGSGEFVVGDEGSGKVWFVDDDGDGHDSIEIDGAEDGNSGIEGLVVTPAGHLFVVKEKDPIVIYELDTAGNLLASDEVDFAGDLSGITYNPLDGHLYVLSDQDQALFRLTSSLVPDRGWTLPVDKPEGLAFDGNTLYVVSDSEDRIYTFSLVP
jgi:uncharacterized protein YjiK